MLIDEMLLAVENIMFNGGTKVSALDHIRTNYTADIKTLFRVYLYAVGIESAEFDESGGYNEEINDDCG